MTIIITYKHYAMFGTEIVSRYIANSLEEAEKICQQIETTEGYEIIDVTREN